MELNPHRPQPHRVIVAEYSPTVERAYRVNADWFVAVDGIYDADGYNKYGYGRDGTDRAGNSREDYAQSRLYDHHHNEVMYTLMEDVYLEWDVSEEGLPRRKKDITYSGPAMR